MTKWAGVECRCLETRTTPDGFKTRRYEREDGTRFSTIEVPLPTWNGVNSAGRARDRKAQWVRGQERASLHAKALEHYREGWKAEASAHELGLKIWTIYRLRRIERARATQRKD